MPRTSKGHKSVIYMELPQNLISSLISILKFKTLAEILFEIFCLGQNA